MAFALVTFYQRAGRGWAHKPTVLRGIGSSARDESLLRYWGLFEEETEKRDDGGRAGWWRVTEDGEQFIHGRRAVPSHAVVYDGRCLGLEGSGITLREALGTSFDYAALMADLASARSTEMALSDRR